MKRTSPRHAPRALPALLLLACSHEPSFAAIQRATTVAPFFEYKMREGEFSRKIEDAANVGMQNSCAWYERVDCKLVSSSDNEIGPSYCACEANYSLYVKELGYLIGPFENRKLRPDVTDFRQKTKGLKAYPIRYGDPVRLPTKMFGTLEVVP